MQQVLVFLFTCACITSGITQQTVGVFVNELEAFSGYTLFAPMPSRNTYLIDNCGRLMHQWPSSFRPAESVYLEQDGSILRTAKINSTFVGGGSGGRIERISWEGDLIWSYNYSSTNVQQHHDIEPLANGHILVIAWELKTQAEAIALGRKPSTVSTSGLWPDHIVELVPIGTNEAEIAWEWHVWDHLIQDFDSTKTGFGVIADHPELVDLNFAAASGPLSADWLHFNAVDYNAALDQIVISVHNFNEIWVVDHSTTSEEAAGHEGGKYGQGGDILYRWGNPQAYDRGTPDDKVFNGQHDARWVDSGIPGAGQISVFNNNHGLGQDGYSSVDYFEPVVDSMGNYILESGQAFDPLSLSWTYDGLPDNSFYSNRLSGAQRLPNGNTLICVGNLGKFMEVTPDGAIVWLYVSPVTVNGFISQGSISFSNSVFRAERFPLDFVAFDGRELTPGDQLELDPLPLICPDTISSVENFHAAFTVNVAPNPVSDKVALYNPEMRSLYVDIFSADQMIGHFQNSGKEKLVMSTERWPQGLIIVVIKEISSTETVVFKLLKL